MAEIREIIKGVVSRVNSTLNWYEKDYISAKRTKTTLDNERCSCFEQYVEIRFNRECCEIPELERLIEGTDGHLFICTELLEPDIIKRKYKMATITINPELLLSEDENLKIELEKVLTFLGGNKIKFNGVKKKIKLFIE